MILCLFFFCLLGVSMAEDIAPAATGNLISSKSVMCYFRGHMMDASTELINLDPQEMPCECDVVIYSRCSVDKLSVIDVDKTFLQSVIDVKPVVVTISRDDEYNDWGIILGPEGNAKEVKVLCDFAKETKIAGYLLEGLSPGSCIHRPFNSKVGQYIIPYLKQLSECFSGIIIGVTLEPYASSIKNPCMYDFEAMNAFVTFYEVTTYLVNKCSPTLYNGGTPISKVEHGANYLFGMEEVASFLKESKICPTKIAYDIELFPLNSGITSFSSYSQVCKGEFNCSTWCIPNTKNLYDKGQFALEQETAIVVKFIDLDDIKNECSCSSAFIGFKNIVAGFRGGARISCAKYDVQSTEYSIK